MSPAKFGVQESLENQKRRLAGMQVAYTYYKLFYKCFLNILYLALILGNRADGKIEKLNLTKGF